MKIDPIIDNNVYTTNCKKIEHGDIFLKYPANLSHYKITSISLRPTPLIAIEDNSLYGIIDLNTKLFTPMTYGGGYSSLHQMNGEIHLLNNNTHTVLKNGNLQINNLSGYHSTSFILENHLYIATAGELKKYVSKTNTYTPVCELAANPFNTFGVMYKDRPHIILPHSIGSGILDINYNKKHDLDLEKDYVTFACVHKDRLLLGLYDTLCEYTGSNKLKKLCKLPALNSTPVIQVTPYGFFLYNAATGVISSWHASSNQVFSHQLPVKSDCHISQACAQFQGQELIIGLKQEMYNFNVHHKFYDPAPKEIDI